MIDWFETTRLVLIPVLALVVSGLALFFTLKDRRRRLREAASVRLTFVLTLERLEPTYQPPLTQGYIRDVRWRWTLHNSGGATIWDPSIRIEGDDDDPIFWEGRGAIPSAGSLRVMLKSDPGSRDRGSWDGLPAIVRWTDANGKPGMQKVTLTYEE